MLFFIMALASCCFLTSHARTATFIPKQRIAWMTRRGGALVPDDDENALPESSTHHNHDDTEDSPVGVKAHPKKGNAVGDPDGEGSDDDDDSDDSDLDEQWEHLEDELEELYLREQQHTPTTQVQVELELVEDDPDEESPQAHSTGGGGLRLGQRLQQRRSNNNNKKQQQQQQQPQHSPPRQQEELLLEAWQSHVYVPPSPAAWEHLTSTARTLQGAAKMRLDRRTLYAGLLLEWSDTAVGSSSSSSSRRPYLDAATAQALTAAVSLATQPAWRRAVATRNAIRLYQSPPVTGCTLAMQETIAMAMVRSNKERVLF